MYCNVLCWIGLPLLSNAYNDVAYTYDLVFADVYGVACAIAYTFISIDTFTYKSTCCLTCLLD